MMEKGFGYYFLKVPGAWGRDLLAGGLTAAVLATGGANSNSQPLVWQLLGVAGGLYILNFIMGYIRACVEGKYDDRKVGWTLTKGVVYIVQLGAAFGLGVLLQSLWKMTLAQAPIPELGGITIMWAPVVWYAFVIALREATSIAKHSDALGVPMPAFMRRLIAWISDQVDEQTEAPKED